MVQSNRLSKSCGTKRDLFGKKWDANVVTFSREISFRFEKASLNLSKLFHSWFLFFPLILQTIKFQYQQHFTCSFYACWSHQHKNTVRSSVSFYAWGSASVKAVHRTLMKFSPGFNFINILCVLFWVTDKSSKTNPANNRKWQSPCYSRKKRNWQICEIVET